MMLHWDQAKENDIYQWWENQGSKELRVSIWK